MRRKPKNLGERILRHAKKAEWRMVVVKVGEV